MEQINSHLALFTGEGPHQSAVITVLPSDITLAENTMIPIKVLDVVSHHLKFDANERGFHGLIPPSILYQYATEGSSLPEELCVPNDKEGLNLHYLGSQHYILTYKRKISNRFIVHVYDSIPPEPHVWKYRYKDLKKQIELVYGITGPIEIICSQDQHPTYNCGLFAIANTLMILNNQDPTWYTLLPEMRRQLIEMMTTGTPQLRLFHSEKRVSPLNLSKIPQEPDLTTKTEKQSEKKAEKEKKAEERKAKSEAGRKADSAMRAEKRKPKSESERNAENAKRAEKRKAKSKSEGKAETVRRAERRKAKSEAEKKAESVRRTERRKAKSESERKAESARRAEKRKAKSVSERKAESARRAEKRMNMMEKMSTDEHTMFVIEKVRTEMMEFRQFCCSVCHRMFRKNGVQTLNKTILLNT